MLCEIHFLEGNCVIGKLNGMKLKMQLETLNETAGGETNFRQIDRENIVDMKLWVNILM